MRTSLGAADYHLMLDLAASLLDSRSLTDCRQQMTVQLNHCLRGRIALFSTGVHPAAPHQAHSIGMAPVSLHHALGDRVSLRQQHVPNNPLIQHFVRTGDREPRAQQDVLDVSAWRRSDTHAFVRERTGATDHLVIPIPSPVPGLTSVWIARDARFGERDKQLCGRLVPLLMRVDRHFAVLETALRQQPTAGRLPLPSSLTPRELTVLVLLADGLTAAAIGRKLGVSPHTVTKHLSNIYRKFGTRDRLTTVLEAERAGLIPRRA